MEERKEQRGIILPPASKISRPAKEMEEEAALAPRTEGAQPRRTNGRAPRDSHQVSRGGKGRRGRSRVGGAGRVEGPELGATLSRCPRGLSQDVDSQKLQPGLLLSEKARLLGCSMAQRPPCL